MPTAEPSAPPRPSCTTSSVPDGSYVSVTVSYRVPVFVPFTGRILADTGQSYRTVTSSLTMRLEPCSITQSS